MLTLHLLQNCMAYISTLMMQHVLARPHRVERLTATDLRAVTPLIWEHVNPYGRFDFDMETRLDLSPMVPGDMTIGRTPSTDDFANAIRDSTLRFDPQDGILRDTEAGRPVKAI